MVYMLYELIKSLENENIKPIKSNVFLHKLINLGNHYVYGDGVERNVDKAIELWEAACEEITRCYSVMFRLGHLYGDGTDMEPDYEKAVDWWYQLCENDEGDFGDGFTEAMYQLACYYYEGKGVKKNRAFALKCFKYTIDLFYKHGTEPPALENEKDYRHFTDLFSKYKGKLPISEEPDFVINARKMLVKHGKMHFSDTHHSQTTNTA